MKKVELYSPVNEEAGVIMVFSKIHEQLGFPKLVPASARGFDIADIEYKGRRVTVEFEYLSENYINHGHILKMENDKYYVIICYEDNCNVIKRLRKEFNKTNVEVIELKNYIEVKNDTFNREVNDIEYFVLNYNPYYAAGLSINEWANTNVYGLNAQFKNNHIEPGSKILFKQGDYIVAKCEVVRYETFERPTTEKELHLLYNLLSYPIGIFNLSIEELKENLGRGYIFYDDFVIFSERKVSFKNTLPDKKMSQSGKINITKEEYDSLLGK